MNFGEKLRQERNLTQPELAESIGIEQSYLSKLENGRSLPSNEVLKSVLDVFGLDIGTLVDNLDQRSRNQRVSSFADLRLENGASPSATSGFDRKADLSGIRSQPREQLRYRP